MLLCAFPNMLKRVTTKRNKLEIKEDAAAHDTQDLFNGSALSALQGDYQT